MAEAALFSFAGTVLGRLARLAGYELCLAWGLKKEINKLCRTADFIASAIRVAETQHYDNDHQITLRLKNLKEVLYDVEDLLDDLSTDDLRRKIMTGNGMVKEVRLFFSKKNQLAYSVMMSHRVKDIRERLHAIAADGNFNLNDHPVEQPLQLRERAQTYSFVREEEIIGRDDDKKKIVKLLLESEPEENVSVIPVVGFGGIGKTTFAKMVFRDENVEKHFELKMWVCVSDKFELRVIVEKIIEEATKSKPEHGLQMQTLHTHLRDKVIGKKYLLVLDDVWDEDRGNWLDLRNLLLGGARGSWIVITTRSRKVAQITGTVSSHELQGLSQSQSWSVLKQMAFDEKSQGSNDSGLEAIAMEIVEKCKGVPLALKVIGKLLFERPPEVWLRVKNNVSIYITQEETGILPILKLSYDHLPWHLRQCFAYCSLIPKDTWFEVEELIRLWIAQGFIQPLSEDEDLEDVGRENFKDLLWRSFFQVERTDDFGNVEWFTMHDLMHDLACSVAGTEYCIAGLKAENVEERTRHVSFENVLDSSWEIPNTLLKSNKLRSFIRRGSDSLDVSTWSALMSNFKYLRMLNLSFAENQTIERLPHSIGNLKHLKALYLSGTEIKTLPSSLSRLQNLQILDLKCCYYLENLPRKTSRLVSLKHLRIDGGDRLCYMPRGLGQLTCLQTLSNFVVGKTGRGVGQLRELNGLNKLKVLGLSSLQNVILEHGLNLKDKSNLKSLELNWSWTLIADVKDEKVFESLQPHPDLQKLKVCRYPGSKISSWLSFIVNLTELELFFCAKCKHLPPLHQLSSLKCLRLYALLALENVSEIEMQKELSSAESIILFLPSLEDLCIEDCPNLKGWWRVDVDETSNAQLPCFPCLANLYIENCPNLTSMPLFPSVKDLMLRKTSSKPLQQTLKLKSATSEAPSSSSSCSIFHPFSQLETLRLKDIEDIDSMPSLHRLSSLKILVLHRLKALENVSEIEKRKELSSAESTISFFPSLEDICIEDCPNLKGWWRDDVGEASDPQLPCFSRVSKLSIEGCPNLTSMQLFPAVRNLKLGKTSWKKLQETMKFKTTTSSAPSSSFSSPIFPFFSNLKTLELGEIEDLESMPPLHQLSSLTVLKLHGLKALESVSEIEMQKELSSPESTTLFFPSLFELEIKDCPNLKGWWRDDVGEDSNPQLPCFPCLSYLRIYSCPNLTSMPLFPSVGNLKLGRTKWKPLIQPTMKMKRTTSETRSSSSSSSSSSSIFPPFSELFVLCLDDIEDLDSLPEEFLQNLTSLWRLQIERCINLTSMPEGMHRLTSLSYLCIKDCPQLSERCKRDIGVDWPNIAHIEEIEIDGRRINRRMHEGTFALKGFHR